MSQVQSICARRNCRRLFVKTRRGQSECSAHPDSPDRRQGGWSGRDNAEHKRFARAVKKRDGYRCVICGATEDLRAAHIISLAAGGTNDPANGRTLCATCDKDSDPHAR